MATNPFYPPILKLAPGRATRRLALVHRGLFELHDFVTQGLGPSYEQLERWGLIALSQPRLRLEAYGGFRPTPKGKAFLIYDETFHLIMVRKNKVKELQARHQEATVVQHESWGAENALFNLLLQTKGIEGHYDPHSPTNTSHREQRDEVMRRYKHRGFQELQDVLIRHEMSEAELVIAGLLRYMDRRGDGMITDMVVGDKAKDCLLLSTRWQFILVKPDMARALLDRCVIEVRNL